MATYTLLILLSTSISSMAESSPELAFTSIVDRGSSQRFKGIVVDVQASKITLAISAKPPLAGMTEQDVHEVGECSFSFVQVDRGAASKLRPEDWSNNTIAKLTPWPDSPARILTAYKDLEAEVTAASSNEMIAAPIGQPLGGYPHQVGRPSRLLGRPAGSQVGAGPFIPAGVLLASAARRFGVAPNSDSEADEDEGDVRFADVEPRLMNRHLPPGGLPAEMEPPARPQRTSPQDEIAALINSGLIDAKDAAYLKVLQFLVRPSDPQPGG